MKDYYQTLGVSNNASDADIKKSYRKLASKHHPDRGGDADEFKRIQEAYDVLSNPQTRQEYDNPMRQHQRFDDILDTYFRHHGANMHRQRQQMQNARITLWINLEDVATGGNRIMTLGGSTGTNHVEIDIPKGVSDNENIRYPNVLPNGIDLVVNFRQNPHKIFHREGLDLWCEKTLNFWELIVGTSLDIKDIQGNTVTLKVPPKTKPGSSLRLRGKGLERDRYNTGDMFVRIRATMPDNIPDEIVDILTKLVPNK